MNNSSETVNNTSDLSRLIAIFRNHFKFLIVWTLLIGVLGFVVAEFVVVPKYTAPRKFWSTKNTIVIVTGRPTITNRPISR